MSPTWYSIVVLNVAASLVSVAFGFQAAPGSSSPRGLKDKIVFVRADPSIGVSSMRSITVAESGPQSIGEASNIATGAGTQGAMVTNTHDAPDMQGRAVANPKTSEIALMNPDGSGVKLLHVFGSDPMLSPDGSRIIYCSQRETIYSQIYVMNADGHGLDPSWSPDGRQIAFAAHRDGIFQIYAMNSDGSNVRRLTKHNAEDSNPSCAPDGSSIVYISATSDDHRGLFLMAPDGSDPHGLVHSKHQDYCFPSWSPDAKTVVFSALNRLGSQGIVAGEEKPRCEQWSGEYQMFAMDAEGKLKQLSDAKLMGTRPSYGRAAAAP